MNQHPTAIFVEGLTIGYGSVRVMEGLNMKVPAGSIYGLLGPSGCGKSTLLKVLLGRLFPDSGIVLVLGRTPGSKGHRVPGDFVGYAPQEPALYTDITIGETFQFHAKLQGIPKEKFENRKKWLTEFLDLPPEDRVVRKLSGGQNRRVSLAVALLHDPQLIILDEPTVGVDPLLRSRIWQHLGDVARSGATVIITTHYIEEARQAHCVGLMRNGRLLAEGHPLALIDKYSFTTLEEVFLALCKSEEISSPILCDPGKDTTPLLSYQRDEEENALSEITSSSNNSNSNLPINAGEVHNKNTYKHDVHAPSSMTLYPSFASSFLRFLSNIFAIAQRKSKQIYRNKKMLAFTLLTPAFQIFLFFVAIGPNPRNLNLVVVNADTGGAGGINLGNTVVANLAKDGNMFSLHPFQDLDYAINRVKQGKDWGVVYIPSNFTHDMAGKFFNPTDPDIQYQSTIHLFLDMSNYQVTVLIQQMVLLAFEETVSAVYHYNISPVQVDQAVYGSTDVQFKNFLAPGMIALICFAHSIGITAVAFVREKNDGTMDRIYAAGVSSKAIIIGHYFISNAILITQTCMLLALVVFVFHVDIVGNIAWVIVILLALGGVGMSLGLVISGAAAIETEAVQLSLSAYFPALLLSGVIWPLEAIPTWLAWLSYALPTTWAAQGLRSIMIRGWGITHPQIWQSILIIVGWSIALMFIAVLILKTNTIKFWVKQKFSKTLLKFELAKDNSVPTISDWDSRKAV